MENVVIWGSFPENTVIPKARPVPDPVILVFDLDCTLTTKHVTNPNDKELVNMNAVHKKLLQRCFTHAGWKNGGDGLLHHPPVQPSQAQPEETHVHVTIPAHVAASIPTNHRSPLAIVWLLFVSFQLPHHSNPRQHPR